MSRTSTKDLGELRVGLTDGGLGSCRKRIFRGGVHRIFEHAESANAEKDRRWFRRILKPRRLLETAQWPPAISCSREWMAHPPGRRN